MYNKLKQDKEERVSYQNDELDLQYVFEKIGAGFQSIFRKISLVVQAARRRALLIFLFVLLGTGIGYICFKFIKPYFTSSMTLVLSDIRNEFVENHLTNLSDMIREGNIIAVAQQLDIKPEAAKGIKEMKFVNLDQDRIAEDSVLTGSPFYIQLSVYNTALFETMEPAITDYLENNRYFSKQKRIRQREIESLIAKLKDQIESIDSVKATVVSPRGPVNGFVYGQPIDPTNLYRESMALYQQQVELEAELDQLDNIQVVNGFTPRYRPTGPNLLKFLVIGGFISFIIGLIVALVLENRKRKNITY